MKIRLLILIKIIIRIIIRIRIRIGIGIGIEKEVGIGIIKIQDYQQVLIRYHDIKQNKNYLLKWIKSCMLCY
jgi:hypothetical protein